MGSGLASASGSASPDNSTPVISGVSRTGLTFQFTASTSPQYIAAAWQAAHSYTLGQVVVNQGRVYRCTTAGTSAATGNGPLVTGDEIEDGSAEWRGVGPFINGFEIANADASLKVYWSIGEATSTTIGKVIQPGASQSMTVADPSLISVIAASGTPVLTIAGLS